MFFCLALTRRRPNGEKRRVELFSFQPVVVVYVVSSLLETKRTSGGPFCVFPTPPPRGKNSTGRLERNSLKREKRYDTGEGRDHPKKGHIFAPKRAFLCVFLPLQNTERKRRKKEKTDPCRCIIRILLFPTDDDDDNNRPQQIAAGAAAVMLFNSAPAHAEIMGLTLKRRPDNRARKVCPTARPTADRLSTSRRTAPGTSRRKKVESRRTWRDRTLGARRLPVNRASTLCLASKFVYYV